MCRPVRFLVITEISYSWWNILLIFNWRYQRAYFRRRAWVSLAWMVSHPYLSSVDFTVKVSSFLKPKFSVSFFIFLNFPHIRQILIKTDAKFVLKLTVNNKFLKFSCNDFSKSNKLTYLFAFISFWCHKILSLRLNLKSQCA